MQRKLTRHVIVCINSFNSSKYVKYALDLINQITLELNYGGIKFSILCVFGGCSGYEICTVNNTKYVTIPQNLSDHNVYMGINHCHHVGALPDKATCVMIHDTCMVKQGCFRKMMMKLSRYDLKGWVFGHALGLYNIGACDVQFAIDNSQNWIGINHLEKQTSIKLEHSRESIEVQNKKVPGLRSFSNKTLNQGNSAGGVKDFNELDYHSIIPMREDGETKTRHVVFIGSLGVYKFTHSPGSFLLPIWVNEYAPKTEDEYSALSSNVHVKQNEWVRALIPYIPTKITCEER